MTYYPTNKRYEQTTLRKVIVAFNRNTEPELVEWIERKENKAGYIKRLILEDLRRAKTSLKTPHGAKEIETFD